MANILEGTRHGLECMKKVNVLLEVNSKDLLGDRRVEMAITAIKNPKSPMFAIKFQLEKSTIALTGSQAALDNSMWPMLDDVFSHVVECEHIWSKARAAAAVPEYERELMGGLKKVVSAARCHQLCEVYRMFSPWLLALSQVEWQQMTDEGFSALHVTFKSIYRFRVCYICHF